MIFFPVVIVGVVGLGVGAWQGSLLWCLLVALMLLVYLLLLLQDFFGLNQSLAKLLDGNQVASDRPEICPGFVSKRLVVENCGNGQDRRLKQKQDSFTFVPLTSYGRKALTGLIALQYRLASKQWEASLPEIDSLELFKESDQIALNLAGQRLKDVCPLFARLLQLLQENFRAAAQAIVVAPVGTASPCRCYSTGRFGASFETCLIRVVEGYFSRGDTSCLGQHDHLIPRQVESALTKFDLFHSLCFAFEYFEKGHRRQALIWLGYLNSQPPFEIERVRAQKFAIKLSNELRSSSKLSEMAARARDAETQSRQKSEYIAHVSHDIRSPLNNIKSILSLLRCEVEQQPSIQELIEIALTNCTNLAEIVEDILDYAKHQAGQLIARPEVFSLAQVVGEIIAGFSVSARLKGLDLRYSQDQNNKYLIFADRRHIKRVISNFVSNAIKYTDRGEVEMVLISSSSGHCVLTVRDTGIGMGPNLMRKLFKPFQRGDHSEIEGVGLGLALAKILLELNGGKVVLSSELGCGSEFTVVFPAYHVQEEEYSSQPTTSPKIIGASVAQESLQLEQQITFKTANLLLIDDDFDCVDTLARNLKVDGFRVTKAITLKDAFKMLSFEKPDLILTDAKMPMGGAEKVLEVVRSQFPGLPVIVISGLGCMADRKRYLALGADEVFEKPVDFDVLRQQIQVSLGFETDKTRAVAVCS